MGLATLFLAVVCASGAYFQALNERNVAVFSAMELAVGDEVQSICRSKAEEAAWQNRSRSGRSDTILDQSFFLKSYQSCIAANAK